MRAACTRTKRTDVLVRVGVDGAATARQKGTTSRCWLLWLSQFGAQRTRSTEGCTFRQPSEWCDDMRDTQYTHARLLVTIMYVLLARVHSESMRICIWYNICICSGETGAWAFGAKRIIRWLFCKINRIHRDQSITNTHFAYTHTHSQHTRKALNLLYVQAHLLCVCAYNGWGDIIPSSAHKHRRRRMPAMWHSHRSFSMGSMYVGVYVCIYVVVFVIAPVFDYNLTWQNVNLNIGINFIHLRTLILSCGGRVRVCVGVCWCVCEREWRSDVEQRDGMERNGRRFSGECVCVHTHTWGVETRCFVCELWCWWWRCLVRNDDFSTSNVCVCTRMPNCEMILNKKKKEKKSVRQHIT